MCEFSERLVAWLDNELLEGDSAEMERHLAECVQCRGRLDAYRQASDAFKAYYNAYGDAGLSAKRGRTSAWPARAIYGAAAIAAAFAAVFLFTARPWPPQEPKRVEISSTASAAQPVLRVPKEPVRAVASSRTVQQEEKNKRAAYASNATRGATMEAPWPEENTNSLLGAPAVEIAIPADAIFPPGAIPAGVGFSADVTMASDGSAEQIRLQLQLAEFLKRGVQR